MSYTKLDSCFNSLFAVKEVRDAFDGLSKEDLDKIFSELLFFDEYGTHTAFYKVEFLNGADYANIFEIKVKLSAKREYRILATKCSENKRPADYLLLHAFVKKDRRIADRDKEAARKRMVKEGL